MMLVVSPTEKKKGEKELGMMNKKSKIDFYPLQIYNLP